MRRTPALMVALGGTAILAGMLALGPDVMSFENAVGSCGSTPEPDTWLYIRHAQLGDSVLHYDTETDRTWLAPGCGHGTWDYAMYVEGDVTGFTGHDWMLLRPGNDVTGHLEPLPGPQQPDDEQHPIEQAWSGTYHEAQGWWYIAPLLVALATTSGGVAAHFAVGGWKRQVIPAAGAGLGAGFGAVLATAGFFAVLFMPVMAFLGMAGALVAAVGRRGLPFRPGGLFMVAFAGAALAATALLFLVFPQSPEA